ncbi:MAG TPA: hypothetical protein VFV54_01365 [Thermoanaerobaculia bacterium]|nr:hypothetical protein [Thermoanaerobaculia bacterium]
MLPARGIAARGRLFGSATLMEEALTFVAFFAAWFLLVRFVFPRLGLST